MSRLVLDDVNDMAWFNEQPLDERKRLARHWLNQALEKKLPDSDIGRIIDLLNWLNSPPLPFDELED